MLPAIRRRLRSLLLRTRAESELQDEFAFHLAEETDKLVLAGYPESEAKRRARLAFGGVERFKEEYRDGRGDGPLMQVAADVRHALRILARTPGLTTAALATLTLGIGSVIALFTVVNAVVLRPLPFHDPDRLVALWEDNPDKGWVQQYVAPANLFDWETEVSSFESIAGYTGYGDTRTLTSEGDPLSIQATTVTGRFFEVLGVRAQRGVFFDSADTWSRTQKVVISDRLFREQLNGDESRVGGFLSLDGTRLQVVGVAPATFGFPNPGVDVWVSWQFDPAQRHAVWMRRAHMMRAIARIDSDVSLETAQADLKRVMTRLERDYPETNTHMYAGLGDLQSFIVGGTRKPLLLLFGGTAILLLIACANVGNLLLVRAASREREFVVRRALGAAPGRVMRQAFVESLVLSASGTALAAAFGWVGVRVISSMMPAGFLPVEDLTPDIRVMTFAAVVALATGVIFGVAPARWGARRDPADVLKENSRGGTDSARGRTAGRSLAVAEVVLALVLAVGAGLLARSFAHLVDVPPGFRTQGIATMRFGVRGERYDGDTALITLHTAMQERVRAIPGIGRVAMTSELPLGDYSAWTSPLIERGREVRPEAEDISHRAVSSDYFEAMGVPLLAGRFFGPEDLQTSEPVVILNRTAARAVFGSEDPLGRHVANGRRPDSTTVWYRVVGVVGDEHQTSLGTKPSPEVFAPLPQDPPNRATVVATTTGDPDILLPQLRKALSETDPALAPVALASMPQVHSESVGRERTLTTLFVSFALVGAVLALIGVYGVIAQLALRRTQEIGIRVALGAPRGAIRWMIVREGLVLASIGITIGLVLSLAIGGVIRGLLHGVTPTDPVTLAAMPVLLFAVTVAACLVPAIKATRADPASVLRGANR